MESMTTLGFLERARGGVKTILPSSTVTSSRSPERSPSLRRKGLGNTTCPFVKSFVRMARQSYVIPPGPATQAYVRTVRAHAKIVQDFPSWACSSRVCC